jgi:predicted nucleic acid-binding protein
VKTALDANILVYASGLADGQRQAGALALIEAIPSENLILPVIVVCREGLATASQFPRRPMGGSC